MRLEFTVKRKRSSVTQGFASVLCNGIVIEGGFGDEISLNGQYGDDIGGWKSTKPDSAFIEAVAFPGSFRREVYPQDIAIWEQRLKEAAKLSMQPCEICEKNSILFSTSVKSESHSDWIHGNKPIYCPNCGLKIGENR